MKQTLPAIIMLIVVFVSVNTQTINFNNLPNTLSLIAEDVISTYTNEWEFFISPDGSEIYFAIERNELPAAYEFGATYKKIKEANQTTLNGTGNIYWASFEKVLNSIR